MGFLVCRGYQVHFVEVYRILREQTHLHLTCLTEAMRIDMRQLERLSSRDLTAFALSDDSRGVM